MNKIEMNRIERIKTLSSRRFLRNPEVEGIIIHNNCENNKPSKISNISNISKNVNITYITILFIIFSFIIEPFPLKV
jgi:hypothetical protein